MKCPRQFFICIAIVVSGSASNAAFANNWQWELDRIKANQKREAKCVEARKAEQLIRKLQEARRKAESAETAHQLVRPAIQ